MSEEKNGPSKFDVLIKNGFLYDGTGSDGFKADIGISGDKITAVGDLHGQAGSVIDADDMMVTPGFIDVHTHCDMAYQMLHGAELRNYKEIDNYIYQGVTTVVTGNCGYGYTDANQWLDMIEDLGFGTNVYHLAPHGLIRLELFGPNQPEELSANQLETLKARVAEEMDKGAIGMSTGLGYAPGLLAPDHEIIELCKVVAQKGGLHASHIRDLSGRTYPDGSFGVVKSIEELIEIGRQAEVSTQVSHLIIKKPFNDLKAEQVLQPIKAAIDEGLDVLADQHPYAAGSTYLIDVLPNRFKDVLGIKNEYKSASGKEEIKAAVRQVFAYLGPEKMLISLYKANPAYDGLTVAQVADRENVDPAEAFVELACDEQAPMTVFFFLDGKARLEFMTRDYIITSSDGWTVPKGASTIHPRAYGTFIKKLKQFSLAEKLISLPACIRSMTSLPAVKYKMNGRGIIVPGNYADINVIDAATLDTPSTYLDPHRYSAGVVHQWVNGVYTIKDRTVTGCRGGKGLRN
jgi:N-acyl-D-aspartate/D-glutamate deacylase